MKWLLLGAKEYPFGAGSLEDPLPSGGYEKYAESLAQALAEAGNEVHIVTRRFKRPAVAAGQKWAQNDKTQSRIHVHTVLWLQGKLLRNPSFNTLATLKAAKLDYDIVLAQGVMGTLSALALKKINGKPVISMPAGVAFSQPQHGTAISGTLQALEKWAYRHADAVVFLSPEEKNAFHAKLGFLPERRAVIAPGVAMPEKNQEATKTQGKKQKSQGALEKRKSEKALQLLFVGRLVGVKGLDVLLHAMDHVPDSHLTVVGNGPEEEKLKDLAKKLGLGNVHFAGYHSDPSSFYKAADAFVLPSFSEGLPLSALEAASHGLALVVTDIGLPFVDEKTALVVPPKNPEALAKALRALQNGPLRHRLGSAARRFVEKQYNWPQAVGKLERLAASLKQKTR